MVIAMTHFGAPMPEHPLHQVHADPKHSDGIAFLRRPGHAYDVNLTWKWNDPKRQTEASGGVAYGLHWPDPRRNGYDRITVAVSGHLLTRRMTPAESHKQDWSARQVRRWRRGKTRAGERPRTYSELTKFAATHNKVIVGELKSHAFADHPFVMRQLVATARRNDHPAYYKSLSNMYGVQKKAANTAAAGGWFAVIFGRRVKGRAARVKRGRAITAGWPADVLKRVRIW